MIRVCEAECWGGCWLLAAGGLSRFRSGFSLRRYRDVIDDAVAAAGWQAKRSDGKLPPHVIVYFTTAMALFAEVISSSHMPTSDV